MSADQIRMMKKDHAILISGSELPINLKIKPYFEDRRLKRMTRK